MSTANVCPDRSCLQGLLAGQLSEVEQEETIRHVEACAACQHVLDSLTPASQSWEDVALQLQKEHPAPALRQVIEQAKASGLTWKSPRGEDSGLPSPAGRGVRGEDSGLPSPSGRGVGGEGPDKTDAEDKSTPHSDAAPGQETQAEQHSASRDEDLGFLTPSARPDAIGRLGHYEILQVIGKGGFGVVLKAFDEKLHRIVAIKVLSPAYAASGSARKRFIREARAAAAVKNEHVVAIYNVQDEAQPPYLVMELIDGISLQDKLDKQGSLGVKEILRISMQIAEGLAVAHKQGLVHRDIKPANILLENGVERVKITDFGLARAVDDASLTQSGTVAGTPMYMSPEQAEGLPIDHRSDLFSLGTVLYAMCTGHPPFRASGTHAVLKRVIDAAPRPIRQINNEIPDWLCAIISKLHAKKPEDRFQSAKEVAELLGQHLADVQAGRVIERRAECCKVSADSPLAKVAKKHSSVPLRTKITMGVMVVVGLGLVCSALMLPHSPAGLAFAAAGGSLCLVALTILVMTLVIPGRWMKLAGMLTTSVLVGVSCGAIVFGIARLGQPTEYELTILVERPADNTDVPTIRYSAARENETSDEFAERFRDMARRQDLADASIAITAFGGNKLWRPAGTRWWFLCEKNGNLLYHKLVTVDRSQEVHMPWATELAKRQKVDAKTEPGWVQLFNGEDLDGWDEQKAAGRWKVANNILTGTAAKGVYTNLPTLRKDFGNFHLRANARVSGPGNGGVLFRAIYQAEMDYIRPGSIAINTPWKWLSIKDNSFAKDGEWFSLEIITDGPRLKTLVNGQPIADTTDSTSLAGEFALELDARYGAVTVEFKKIEITELPPDPGWVQLFNGKDVTGWVEVYDKKKYTTTPWDIVESVLVLKGGKGQPTGYLRTEKQYREFHLRFDYEHTSFAPQQTVNNSHVYWGMQGPDDPETIGWTLTPAKVEPKRADSGGALELNTATRKQDGKVFHDGVVFFGKKGINKDLPWTLIQGGAPPADKWNRADIISKSGEMEVRINGVSKIIKGYQPVLGNVALFSSEQGLHLRNIEIKELPPQEPGWVQLFNGKDLTGWKLAPQQPGNWSVDKDRGVLIGKGPAKASHLFTERGDFQDFHLRAEAKINLAGNSGIYFRSPYALAGGYYPKAYEAQIFVGEAATFNEQNKSGSLYGLKVFKDVIAPADSWFTMEIIARGKRLTIKVNGTTTVDNFEDDKYQRGHFALQQLGAETVVEFKKIEIKELPRTLPKKAADIPRFIAGAWKIDSVIIAPKLPPDHAKMTGFNVFEPICGGKFLRGYSNYGNGKFESLMVHRYNEATDSVKGWFFSSQGDNHWLGVGRWNAETRTMLWLEKLPSGLQATYSFEFTDATTIKTRVYHTNDKNDVIFELQGTGTRLPGPVDLKPAPIDPKRPPEMKIFDSFVGEWETAGTMKMATKKGLEEFKFTTQLKSRYTLGGRMIATNETGLPGYEDLYWLMTYDTNLKAYRFWMFNGAGEVTKAGGLWDEQTQTMHWKHTEDDGRSFSSTWKQINADRWEWTTLIRDAIGNTLFDIQATKTRRGK